MRKPSLRVIAALFTLLFSFFQSAHAVQIDKVIVFGDSLSDNGNIYSLTKKFHKIISSVPIIPKDPPYYEGRFSNGLVWIDNVASSLNVPLLNYAYGGSWAEPLKDSRLMIPFGLGMQVNAYLVRAVTDRNKGDHLYIIWAGGNDYAEGREDIDYATTNTVNSIESQIDWLTYYGAKNLLILNLPDLSIVPEVTTKGPDSVEQVKKLIAMHNSKLAKMVAEMQAKHADAKIIFGDITPYFDDVYSHHDQYNITDVTNPCYTGDYSLKSHIAQVELNAAKGYDIDIIKSPSLRIAYSVSKLQEGGTEACAAPDEHMFWDQIHPTRVVHHLIALDAMTILSKNDIQGKQ